MNVEPFKCFACGEQLTGYLRYFSKCPKCDADNRVWWMNILQIVLSLLFIYGLYKFIMWYLEAWAY